MRTIDVGLKPNAKTSVPTREGIESRRRPTVCPTSFHVLVALCYTLVSSSLSGQPAEPAARNSQVQHLGERIEALERLQADDPQAAVDQATALRLEFPGNAAVGRVLLKALNAAGSFDPALQLAEELSGTSGLTRTDEAQILRERLVAMRRSKQLDGLDGYAQKALELTAGKTDSTASDALSPLLASRVLSDIAITYNAAVQYSAASDFYQKALDARPSASDATQRLNYSNMGAMLAKQGRFPEAIRALQEGLRIVAEPDREVTHNLYKNLGGLHLSLGKFQESLPYTLQALETTEANSPGAASLYSNLGVTYQQLRQFDEAEINYKKALEISDRLGMDNVSALNNLAFLLHEKGRHRESLDLLARVRRITETNQQWDILAVSKKNQAENWIALGQRSRAADLMEEARQLYLKHDLRPNRLELYPIMIDNLEDLGRFERALELMREYKALYDETVSVDSATKVAQLEAQFELERKERELATAQRDRALNETQIHELQHSQDIERGVRELLLLGVALLTIIAFLLLRALHFRGRANRVLAEKNEQIAAQAMTLSALNEQLLDQSRNDELTGLFNRRFLNLHLTKELPRLERVVEAGGEVRQLIVLADLDHFKRINDRHGHAVGDQVLRAFADALNDCARESDFCVRWGGEEFLWLCRDADFSDGPALCDRLLQAAADAEIDANGEKLSPICSIGFAPFPLFRSESAPGNELDWSLALEAADAALYEAKRTGRNRWCAVRPTFAPATLGAASVTGLLESGDLVIESEETRVSAPPRSTVVSFPAKRAEP